MFINIKGLLKIMVLFSLFSSLGNCNFKQINVSKKSLKIWLICSVKGKEISAFLHKWTLSKTCLIISTSIQPWMKQEPVTKSNVFLSRQIFYHACCQIVHISGSQKIHSAGICKPSILNKSTFNKYITIHEAKNVRNRKSFW